MKPRDKEEEAHTETGTERSRGTKAGAPSVVLKGRKDLKMAVVRRRGQHMEKEKARWGRDNRHSKKGREAMQVVPSKSAAAVAGEYTRKKHYKIRSRSEETSTRQHGQFHDRASLAGKVALSPMTILSLESGKYPSIRVILAATSRCLSCSVAPVPPLS